MKRDPARLDVLVTEALAAIGPAGASALAVWLRVRGNSMSEVQVYRVMRRLVGRGAVRQIWLGRRFIISAPDNRSALALTCRSCGRLDFAPGRDVDQALRSLATPTKFEIEQVILEVAGLCERCASITDARAAKRTP